MNMIMNENDMNEMLKTEVNTLVKKRIQSTMILKKKARIYENQNNFLTVKLSTV